MGFEKKKSGRTSKRPPLEILDMLYQTSTAKEIADVYDVKESTVRSWISRARREKKNDDIK